MSLETWAGTGSRRTLNASPWCPVLLLRTEGSHDIFFRSDDMSQPVFYEASSQGVNTS